ncbi:hypothetical protein OAD26_00660, partial [bacterium]|nr:hypothetical protein [bacterium]
LGYQAGDNVITGSNNIILGYDIDAPSATADNQLNIGNAIYGDLSTGFIGIGTTSPTAKLTVQGTSGQTANLFIVASSSPYNSSSSPYFSIANTGGTTIAPGDMSIVGGVKPGVDGDLNGPRSIAVSGDYAYVAANADNSLRIVDISDPTNPSIVGGVKDDTNLAAAQSVDVSGNYAYVAANADNSLRIVDISDPTNPSIVGGVKDDTNLLDISSVSISGNYAYVANLNDNSLRVIDISDPTNPSIVGGVKDDTNLAGVYYVDVSGNYAYVAAVFDNSLRIIDISDPTNPSIVGGVKDAVNLSAPYTVAVSGNHAYVGANTDNSLRIVDISDPTNPSIVGGVKGVETVSINNITISGNYAYVTAADGAEALSVIDISSSTKPFVVGSIKDSTNLDGARAVAVSGNYAYVVSFDDDSFRTIDLGGLTTPTAEIGTLLADRIDVLQNLSVNGGAYFDAGLNVGQNALIGGTLAITGNSSTTVSTNAAQLTLGGTNVRDSYLSFVNRLSTSSANTWSAGLDDTDGSFKISSSTTLGTNDFLSIAADGTITLGALTGGLVTADGSGVLSTTSTSTLGLTLEDLTDVSTMTETLGDLLYWNGSAWADIATSSLGLGDGSFLGLSDTPGSFTSSAIPYVSGSELAFDSTFVYDGTNLGIGTAAPGAMLDIFGTSNALRLSYDGSNYSQLSVNSGGDLNITSTGGTGSLITLGSGVAAEDIALIMDGN